MTWRPKLRWVLLAALMLLLCLPLAGFGALRIYQHELVRRAEAELVSQGSMVQSSYKALLFEELQTAATAPSPPQPDPDAYGIPADVEWKKKMENWLKPERFHFGQYPGRIHPPPSRPRRSTDDPDPFATSAGRRVEAQLREASGLTRSTIRVLDYKGTVVAATDETRGVSLLHRNEVSKALHGQFVQILRRTAGPAPESSGPRPAGADVDVCVAMPIVREGRLIGAVLLSKSPLRASTAISKVPTLAWSVLLLAAVGLVALVALLRFFVDRPVAALIHQHRNIESSEPAPPVESPGTREFARLSQTLAELAPETPEREPPVEESEPEVGAND